MEEGERRIKQEDCHEDSLGAGILTLTSKRIAFDKTQARMMDFSKRFGDTVVNVLLGDISEAWKEGWLMKKVCIKIKTKDGEKIHKFGVLGTSGWLNAIQEAMNDSKNQ
jgi:hypothetical protein